MWLQIPYCIPVFFHHNIVKQVNDHSVCGTASFCTEPGNAEALELAKWNMRHHYLIVGTTERMESMVRLLGNS
jgi:hypothetical protein